MSNPYEEAGRARKVLAMVSAIDRAAIAKGIDPHGNAGQVLLALIGYTPENWKVVDRVAGLKHASSPDTREEVKKIYRDRAGKDPLKEQ